MSNPTFDHSSGGLSPFRGREAACTPNLTMRLRARAVQGPVLSSRLYSLLVVIGYWYGYQYQYGYRYQYEVPITMNQ